MILRPCVPLRYKEDDGDDDDDDDDDDNETKSSWATSKSK